MAKLPPLPPVAILVTDHAVDRWIERVADVSRDAARAAILQSSNVIRIAADFGASRIVLANGARLIIKGLVVVTVTPPAKLQSKARRR